MKKRAIELGIIVIFILFTSGIVQAWEFICKVAQLFYSMLLSFLPFLDLEQVILCKVVTILIVQALCSAGFLVSHKAESMIGKIVSGVADAVATVLLLIA